MFTHMASPISFSILCFNSINQHNAWVSLPEIGLIGLGRHLGIKSAYKLPSCLQCVAYENRCL